MRLFFSLLRVVWAMFDRFLFFVVRLFSVIFARVCMCLFSDVLRFVCDVFGVFLLCGCSL